MAGSLSLLYALLEAGSTTESTALVTEGLEARAAWGFGKAGAPRAGEGGVKEEINEGKTLKIKYDRKEKGQEKEQVLANLYKVLYETIEYQYMPQNEALNMAIGRALASAIRGETLQNDPHIAKLYAVLRSVVTKAIEEMPAPQAEQNPSST